MKLQQSRIARLKEMISLQEKHTSLQQEIESIQQQLQSLHLSVIDSISTSRLSGGHSFLSEKTLESTSSETSSKQRPVSKGRTAKVKTGSTKRGALSEQILHALAASGKEGITLKDLAEKVGSKYQNVAIWFSTTGKKNSAIKKIVPGRYRLDS
jgi:hypothetical protein